MLDLQQNTTTLQQHCDTKHQQHCKKWGKATHSHARQSSTHTMCTPVRAVLRTTLLSVQAGNPLQLFATVLLGCAGRVRAAAADIRGAVEHIVNTADPGVTTYRDLYNHVESVTGMHNGQFAPVFKDAVKAALVACEEAAGG